MKFLGRDQELEILHRLTTQPLGVATITGRRRVGKSRLATEFARREGRKLIKIEGRDNPQGGNAAQLAAFAADLSRDTGTPKFNLGTWNDAFNALGTLIQDKQWIVLLDEITWLARHSAECLPELKVFIDHYLNGSGNCLLVCGSISHWIEQYIHDSDLFVGRISSRIVLQPLPLADCARFWVARDVSAREILTALCVTGGIPRYLEEIDPRESAEWNIRRLCFEPKGYLVEELPDLIKSSFLNVTRESSVERYLDILASLSGEGKSPTEISKDTGIIHNEHLGEQLAALRLSGIVAENPSWSLKTANFQKRGLPYRVKDPYTRFYVKYIRPHVREIDEGSYRQIVLQQLPGWETIRGLQFESLVTQNMVPSILNRLNLQGVLIERLGPYFQRQTVRQAAVQIDYLIQTGNTLYVCETKFRKSIGIAVADEVQEKIKRLAAPRGMTIRKVLIYSGEREQALRDSIYFDRQICVDELLELGP